MPRVERGESINAGVIVYCRERDFLGARVHLDAAGCARSTRPPTPTAIAAALQAAADTCNGDGPAAAESIGQRFRWLTAPRSTVVQPGPVHTGLTDDPRAELDRLMQVLVLPVG